MLRLTVSTSILFFCLLIMASQAQRRTSMAFHTGVPVTTPSSERPCASNPCSNGGYCIDFGSSFHCRCPPEWTGLTCSSYRGTSATFTRRIMKRQIGGGCTANRCKNGGTCYFAFDDVVCLCPWPWSGETCIENLEKPTMVTTTSRVPTTAALVTTARPVTTMPVVTTARPVTTVQPITTARPLTTMQPITTQRPVTVSTTSSSSASCAQSPCKNGGTCVPRGTSYSCFCGLKSIYSGKNCDSTAPMPAEECPLNCAPAKCIFSGFAERPYACLWNGIMRPVNGTTA